MTDLANTDFTMGIEEEYLLVDNQTMELVKGSEEFIKDCNTVLESQVSPEFLQCQVEIGTKVCRNIGEARDDLKRLRNIIAEQAHKHGMAPIAASCHPFAKWTDQDHTDKPRYRDLERDLAGVARRMLICGMHVHIGIHDNESRIDLMNQLSYFLPHMLALSASSPYWQGEDTGLSSYRLTVFDNLPRTGLPPRFSGYDEYQRSAQMIIDTGQIDDSSMIWWDLRPSAQYPTIESRICDVLPRMEHCLSIAALTQCLVRMLQRLRRKNQRWRLYDNFLLSENRWLAQRYGVSRGLIDFGVGEIVAYDQLLDEMLALVAEDAEALNCEQEVEAIKDILKQGTSSERQRQVFKAAYDDALTPSDSGQSVSHTAHKDAESAAFRAVVSSLVDEFTMDL